MRRRRSIRQTNLVVDIRYVHDILDVELEVVHQNAAYHVRSHIVARVAQVALVVNCRAADVPADLAVFLWDKGNRCAGV